MLAKMINLIRKRIQLLGQAPLCSLKSERAPHLGGFCWLLCWRCTGLILGGLLALACLYWLDYNPEIWMRMAGLLLLALDALLSGLTLFYDSNNTNRFITGLLCGMVVG